MPFRFQSPAGYQVESFSVGPLGCNCSLLWDSESLEAILIDPGAEFEKIQNRVLSLDLKVKAIVHTHAHFDHVGASAQSHEEWKAPLWLHPGDRFLWENLPMQGSLFGFQLNELPPWQFDLDHECSFSLGKHLLKTIYTPGHTPGSCSFSIDQILFAGDTLFKGSVGRTDLWGGDFDTISESIRQRLYQLDDDTLVVCGHGPQTQIGIEKKQNPFVR